MREKRRGREDFEPKIYIYIFFFIFKLVSIFSEKKDEVCMVYE